MLRSSIRSLVPAVLAAALAACSASGPQPQTLEAPVEVAYPAAALERFEEAVLSMQAGDDLGAEVALRALTDRYPDYAGPLVNLGIIYARSGRTDAAVEALAKAIAVCSSCAPAYNELGVIQRRQGQFDAAEDSYLKALDADPDYALAHYNLGVLYDLYQQRTALALEHYETYTRLNDDPEAATEVELWIADLSRRLGQAERAALAGGEQ